MKYLKNELNEIFLKNIIKFDKIFLTMNIYDKRD